MMVVLTVVIAGLGLVFLLLLIQRVREADAHVTLKKHRSQDAGLSDLLIYAAMVEDGVIVGKNGSLMAAWIYRGDDQASSTEPQREALSFRINQALSSFGNGWMVHVDAVRRRAAGYAAPGLSHFPDPLTAALDEERRRLFEGLGTMYDGYFVVTLTYLPPLVAQRKFVELMFDDDQAAVTAQDRTTGLVEQFTRDCAAFESRLSSVFRLHRLRGQSLVLEDGSTVIHDEFLRWLQRCVTGINQPVSLSAHPMYLDAVIGGQEVWTGVIPKIGRQYMQVVAIEGFPLDSTPGILTSLGELPIEYRWSSRFIFMDSHEAVRALTTYRRKWKQKIRGFLDQITNSQTGPLDQDAMAMVADAEAAMGEVNSGVIGMGYYTSVVVLMDEDRAEVERSARRIEKAIHQLGFAARIETLNTMDAFLGSLPGHGVENVRRPPLNTMNLADLLPTSTIWTGSATAPCPMYPPNAPPLVQCVTHGATPFRLNLHVRDVGHTLMLGPTGSGKSTHLGMLAAQLRRYAGMSVYVFDKGQSMYPLAAAIRAHTNGQSGLHFTIAGDTQDLAFCPLQFLETKGDRAWALEWIDTMLALNGVKTTPLQRNAIAETVMALYANEVSHDSAYGQDRPPASLSDFVNMVQDEAIREALKQYTVSGALGHLLDAERDGLALADFMVFEIEELMGLGDKYALPTLLYLFRRIERSMQGQPSAIIVDEAWLMLGHPVIRDKIREWLKVLRKANCLVVLATQSLTDAANSGILDVIVESTATKIFLPNVFARDEDTSALYRRMGLNSRQIEIVATAVPKRQYYYSSECGHRLYDLALGPLALAFVGASDKESIAEIRSLEAKYGEAWTDEWLASRGLTLRDYGPYDEVTA
ncbi:MAG: VirB4 family type IV secretion/conjugal transfer ATPase [Nitrospira sp. CG24B]|jgi:type IV secretion/conjugal transfer VirB4 family ATPase|nr:MAG: VirB4 family type IV secretion/conjugal transfer ATPase [Nitrospira sp. CG24B]